MIPDKTLTVRLNKKFVGYLEQDIKGKFVFTYSKNCNLPLSISLPVREAPYYDEECRGFFEGLLPEGEIIRANIGKKYGINPKNEFSLLKAIGYDCAGAISFTEYEENPSDDEDNYIEIRGKIFEEKDLEKYIMELPKKPLHTSSDGLRLSLAGAQDKMAVVLIGGQVALPEIDVPTTHILKPEIKDLDGSVENEYICLKVAKALGIKVYDCEIRRAGDVKYLLVERYDREIENNCLRRIHQEDFCQANRIVSAYKYESEGGIGFKDCFEIIRQTSKPAICTVELVHRIIFNYLIGNADAHGKNFSILYTPTEIKLAPAYDIMCTVAYPDLTKKMAMKIAKYREFEKIFPRHWEAFAKENNISYTWLQKMIIEQATILPDVVKEVSSEITHPIRNRIIDVVESNCKKVLLRFGV